MARISSGQLVDPLAEQSDCVLAGRPHWPLRQLPDPDFSARFAFGKAAPGYILPASHT